MLAVKPHIVANISSALRSLTVWLSEPITAVVIALFSMLFGTIGYVADGYDYGEAAYRTVSFFVIQGFGDSKAGVNWMVETGRWLAVFVIITTTIRTVYALTREYWQRLLLRTLRGHVVVCGLGEKGFRITEDTHRQGKQVIVIERDPSNVLLDRVRDSGVVTILGDATDTSILQQARLAFADSIYIASGDDAANAEIASQVYRLTRLSKDAQRTYSRFAGDIPCFVHVIDPVIGALIKSHEMYTRSDDMLELRLFNVYERGARYVLEHFPPDLYQPITPETETSPHILIVGFQHIGQSILRQCALTGHYANGKNISATIIERNVNDIAHRFMYHYPAVEEFVDCDWIRIEPTLLDMQMIVAEHESTPFGVVYVALEDLTHSMYMAQRINDALNGTIDIVLCMESSSRAKQFYQQITHPRIHVVNFLQSFEQSLSLLHEPIDTFAMHLYEEEPQMTETSPSDAKQKEPWSLLEKELKDHYRNTVLHHAVQTRALQNMATLPPIPEDTSLTTSQLSTLAPMEHRRYVAQLRLAGWKHGAILDTIRKENPYLTSFENLPQYEQDDRTKYLKAVFISARMHMHTLHVHSKKQQIRNG